MKKFLVSFLSILLISSLAFSQAEKATNKGLLKVRLDVFDGGVNSFDLADVIEAKQGTLMKNVVLNRKGQLFKRKGQALFATDESNTAWTGIGVFIPDVNSSFLMGASGTAIARSPISPASWLLINGGNPLTTGKDTEFIQANNLLFILNGTDTTSFYNGSVFDPGSSNSASPPIATTGAWLRNYLFLAGNPTATDTVSFSNNLVPQTFTASDIFRVNTGDGQRIVKLEPFRINELIVYKEKSIYILDITGSTPLTDWTVQPITTAEGCIAPRSVINIGNDHWYLSSEPIAVRSLVRSEFDKILVQMVSRPVQDIFDGSGDLVINRTAIDKAASVLFDNKYIIGIATGTSTVNNTVLLFDFIAQAWYIIEDWFAADWVKFQNRLFYVDSQDGRVLECFTGNVGDVTEGPVTTSASEPLVGISFEYASKDVDFDNQENFKELDSIEVEFNASGNFTAEIFIEIDDGGFQSIGTINLAGSAPTLPINLPFTLGTSGVARKTFQVQSFGEFKTIKVKAVQNGLSETCNLRRITLFAKMKSWRREQ